MEEVTLIQRPYACVGTGREAALGKGNGMCQHMET